jgi:hypothetical protein
MGFTNMGKVTTTPMVLPGIQPGKGQLVETQDGKLYHIE